MNKVHLLDCTLRDGAYIVDANFGTPVLKGIIRKLQEAEVDLIECGWLKNSEHTVGTSFYHVPEDMLQYMSGKSKKSIFVAMIDWDRYDLKYLPEFDGRTIDAVRVVFPYGKHKEGIKVAEGIRKKGYQVYLQAANTLAYRDEELIEMAKDINEFKPVAISIVDTFGAMYLDDLKRIAGTLDQHLDQDIQLGFHSHNNQQLSFALTMQFIEMFADSSRGVMVDSSLCGMGRGAGNATTELVANYLNTKCYGNYDMNAIMDAIDMYMVYFQENFIWGYSIPYFIAGMYCCHVNNIAYLLKNHRCNAQDMKNIIESLSAEDRKKYDYDLLEKTYLDNQSKIVDDDEPLSNLQKVMQDKKVLLLSPGKSILSKKKEIETFIEKYHPIVIGVNAICEGYQYDYLFFTNSVRYHYAQEIYSAVFDKTEKILLSSIKTESGNGEYIINFNKVMKRGWKHFDNAVITCLRLMYKLQVEDLAIAGFDGFKHKYNESYADISLPTLNPDNQWDELNDEITDMFHKFKQSVGAGMKIEFITESIFNK